MLKNENTNPNVENQETNNGKKKKIALATVVLAGALAVGGIGVYTYSNGKVELKKDQITAEYGSKMPTNAEYYMEGNKIALKGVKIDVSKVDTEKVGTYDATATKGKKAYQFTVTVKDTVKPEVVLKDYLYAIAGKELKSSDMIKEVSDLAGIKSLSFKDAQVEVKDAKDSKDTVPVIALKYDKAGTQKNTLTVEDNNGNMTEVEFDLNVVGAYVGEVKNLKSEWNVVKDSKNMDYMKDITYDTTKVKSVTVDAKKVDTTKAGTYPIIYTVESTSGEKSNVTIPVNVVTKDDAKDLVSNGDKVYTTDNKEFTEKAEETKKEDTKKEESKDTNKTEDKETTDKKDTTTTDKKDITTTDSKTDSKTESSNTSSKNESNSSSSKHTHTWVAQYTTVHHDATGHNEQIQTGTIHHEATGHNETIYQGGYACNNGDFETTSANDMVNHSITCGAGYHSTKIAVGTRWVQDTAAYDEPVYGTRWVQDTAAYDEKVFAGNVCSGCGKKQ